MDDSCVSQCRQRPLLFSTGANSMMRRLIAMIHRIGKMRFSMPKRIAASALMANEANAYRGRKILSEEHAPH
jgi:hypothetical protein